MVAAKSGSYKTFQQTKCIEWARRCSGWAEVRDLSKLELERLPDQWSAWRDFITASCRLDKTAGRLYFVTHCYILLQCNNVTLSQCHNVCVLVI